MADISGVDNLTSNSNGSTSLTGIQAAVDNLNTAKQEKGSGVTGNIPTFGSGNVLGDSGLTPPASTIVGRTDTQTLTNKTLTSPAITNPSTTGTDSGTETLQNKTIAGGSNTITGITEAMQTLADNTTGNVSTSAHGYVPKATNTGTKYLRDDATWASLTNAYTSGLGAWGSATADGAGHQVASDGFLVGYMTQTNTSASTIYSDSSSTPTTVRLVTSAPSATAQANIPFMIPVRKNDYYKISLGVSVSCVAFFIGVT